MRRLTGFIHVTGNTGVAVEVTVNVGLCRATFNAELLGQTKGTHAVDQAEVDGLGRAALFVGHFQRHDAEHFGSRGAVNIFALSKRLQQTIVGGQMRHDAQFDLRVVGRDDAVARRRDEGLANAATLAGTHGDVLQIRVGTGQATGDGRGLRVVRVHASGGRVDALGQLVAIGVLELGDATVFKQQARQRKVLRQFREHFFVGGWCA